MRLVDESTWKRHARWTELGYYELRTADTREVPVRLFLSEILLRDAETTLYRQIVNATRFPGTKMVVITPDVHFGYGVPVGCVILTDRHEGAVAMGPVGFDIGCGMMSARSDVSAERATPDRKLAFNREVMKRVDFGPGGKSKKLSGLTDREFQELVRGGAEHYVAKYGAAFDRTRAERHRIPVRDGWKIPYGMRGSPERGTSQLGSLGGGNHFIELQREEESGKLWVQVHTGSRGFGHGLATNYFDLARSESPDTITELDLGYFTPRSKHFKGYLDAVAAGGNYAIVNRLVLFEQIADAFEKVFREELKLFYEISHNLVQEEDHPELGKVWVHRKGATRAFPAHHPTLAGTPWEETGHPVLIPGSNRDWSFILRPCAGAVRSGFSVNHGAGRRMSRGEAKRSLSQEKVDEQYRREGIIVNDDDHVPLDESAQCYKRCEDVVAVVVGAGLATIEHRLWPLASLKGVDRDPSRSRGHKTSEKRRHKDRDDARRLKRGE